jgi:hypothetical protein
MLVSAGTNSVCSEFDAVVDGVAFVSERVTERLCAHPNPAKMTSNR